MNVASFGIMFGGGILWAFDISSLKEMQTALRGRLGYDSDAELAALAARPRGEGTEDVMEGENAEKTAGGLKAAGKPRRESTLAAKILEIREAENSQDNSRKS